MHRHEIAVGFALETAVRQAVGSRFPDNPVEVFRRQPACFPDVNRFPSRIPAFQHRGLSVDGKPCKNPVSRFRQSVDDRHVVIPLRFAVQRHALADHPIGKHVLFHSIFRFDEMIVPAFFRLDADSASPVGTAQHMTVLKWLEKLGLESTDVSIVNMDSVQAFQALQAGQCDAVSLNVPTFFDALNAGMVQVGSLSEMGTSYVDMVVANRKAVEGKPELVQAYMDALTEACEAIQNDQEMAADLFVQFLKENGSETSRENCVSDLQRARFITRADWKDRQIGRFAKELGEFYVGQGQLEPNVIDKFETNVVDTFVKAYK